jgi:hypothetical protein
LARAGLLAILAVTASSVLWSLSTSFKKSLSSVLSVLTICWMAEAIMPDFLISLAICIHTNTKTTISKRTGEWRYG